MTDAFSAVQLEDSHVVVTRWDLPMGSSTGEHTHQYDYLIVPLTNGLMRLRFPGGEQMRRPLAVGACYSGPAGTTHDVRNDDPIPVSFIEIEFLDRPLRPAADDE